MPKILSNKKKIIIFLFLFSLFLAFYLKADFSQGYFPNEIKNFFEKLIQTIEAEKFLAKAAPIEEISPYFFPRFPQRLMYTISEMEEIIDQLVGQNGTLINLLKESDCKFAVSECLPKITFGGTSCNPGRVLGEPYTNVGEIRRAKEEISDKIEDLSYLRELLIKEEEEGLEAELKTLRPEVAEELKTKLNEVLEKSEKIVSLAKESKEIYSKDYTQNCQASCQAGRVCGIKACLMIGTGPQRYIEIKAKVEVGLNDLELGKIGISKFGLALPDKINFPHLADLTVNISPLDVRVCLPFEPIDISINQPSFGTLPNLSFSCPKLPTLKIPELPIPKLPKEIKIPFPEIPEIKWCPFPSELPGLEELEKIKQELEEAAQKGIEEVKKKIDQEIENINQMMEKAPQPLKEELGKLKNDLQKEAEELKKEAPKEEKTPSVEFQTPGQSKEHQYKSPESQGLQEDLSLFYQCSQKEGDKEVKTGANTSWYLNRLSWLMEECAKLPTMQSSWGSLTAKAKDCYDPDKVIETIINECNELCKEKEEGFLSPPTPLPPLCQTLGCPCLERELAKERECKNLFTQEKEPIPNSCSLEMMYGEIYCSLTGKYEERYPTKTSIERVVQTLKKKCQEIKDKEREDIPQPCKLLPLFLGTLEAPGPEIFSGSGTSCPSQKLLNLPFGFGGGIGFNCPIGLPSSLKIVLPDIIIPDIILPEFGIPPFLYIKLPKIVFEDIILPDIDLCDLNNCANLFPSLDFKFPSLNIPPLSLSVPIPQLPGLQLRGSVNFSSINLSLPEINLFNLLLPELELPQIKIPSPKISFALTGIDLSGIFDLIFTFILNALDIPDVGLCITFKLGLPSCYIAFPDYYFSFWKFPEKLKIPFCQNINQFCENVKNSLGKGGWLQKAKELSAVFNETVGKIQKELDKVSQLINEALQNQIIQVFQEYGELIYEKIVSYLKESGLSVEDYINPQTKEIDLEKIPIPGVFPVRPEIEGKELKPGTKGCLTLSLPDTKVIFRFVKKERKVERRGREITVYLPLDLPAEIPIPWPEKLKEINLINPITYELPKIPLSKLSYKKEFSIKSFGFQPRTFTFDFGKLGNEGDCLAEPPKGGNPVPVGQLESNLNEIRNIQMELESASQVIINILR